MGQDLSKGNDGTSPTNPNKPKQVNPDPNKTKSKLSRQNGKSSNTSKKSKSKKSSLIVGSVIPNIKGSYQGSQRFKDKIKIKSTTASVQSMASVFHPILNYATDHQEVDEAIDLLESYNFDIIAVWVVSRPIDRVANGYFQHWAVKILADPVLLTLDFFEKNGAGAFGVHAVTVGWEELDEFLFYYKKENEEWAMKKWTIESCVIPKFHGQRKKFNNIDLNDDKMYKMPEEITDCKIEMEEEENNKLMTSIKCDRSVSDVAEFISEWNGLYESYNALTSNCQRFVQDLYEWLLSNSEKSEFGNNVIYPQYVERCKKLSSKLQSWKDWVEEVKKWENYEKNKQKLSSITDNSNEDESNDNDDVKDNYINNNNNNNNNKNNKNSNNEETKTNENNNINDKQNNKTLNDNNNKKNEEKVENNE